eukprot:scaffold2776_cov36-Tisochrysis_lutea.AAC.3
MRRSSTFSERAASSDGLIAQNAGLLVANADTIRAFGPSGMHDLDEYLQAQLLLSALGITTQLLRHGGTFVAKIFRGKDITLLYAQLKLFFPFVVCAKPKSSRNSSVEAFVVCRNFSPPEGLDLEAIAGLSTWHYPSEELKNSLSRITVPFVACGDLSGYDADANYPLPEGKDGNAYVVQEPVQKPTTPAYRAFLEAHASGRQLVLDVARPGTNNNAAPPARCPVLDDPEVDVFVTSSVHDGPGDCSMFDALIQ